MPRLVRGNRLARLRTSPTITTLSYNYGAGRFGHPEQDRAISLREAAILQSFPPNYDFVAPEDPVQFAPLGRLIGNAVPPLLMVELGRLIITAWLEQQSLQRKRA